MFFLFYNLLNGILYLVKIKPMSFKGYISGIELTDVVQIINMKGNSSSIEIHGPDNQKGIIYILKGNIIYADIDGKIKGDEAALKIFSWKSPIFKELKWRNPPEKNVTMDTLFIIMEAARLKDEEKNGRIGTNLSQVQANDKLIQFIAGAKTPSEMRKRVLLIIIHNFHGNITTAAIFNSNTKVISTLVHSTAKLKFWDKFRKIGPVINVSIKNPHKPIYIPVDNDVNAMIFTKNKNTLITFLKPTVENDRILSLFEKVLKIIEQHG